mmetsp:Transcript_17765/g.41210  ORF Transcript_17765/g.41210 Transcript_17765/m.41210 type:complete len:240 (+) Transcript_17765:83-802(+)
MDAWIKIRIVGRVEFALELSRAFTIFNVKECIKEVTGLRITEQILTFCGEELRDEYRLWTYHINDGDEIVLDDVIWLRVTGRVDIFISTLQSALVSHLKERIWQTEGIQVSSQELLLGSQRLDNERPLAHYGIESGHSVKLEEKFSLRIKGVSDSAVLFLEVSGTSTIHAIKQCIKEEAAIPIANQQLFLGRRHLSNKEQVQLCGIRNNDTLELKRFTSIPGSPRLVMCIPAESVDSMM